MILTELRAGVRVAVAVVVVAALGFAGLIVRNELELRRIHKKRAEMAAADSVAEQVAILTTRYAEEKARADRADDALAAARDSLANLPPPPAAPPPAPVRIDATIAELRAAIVARDAHIADLTTRTWTVERRAAAAVVAIDSARVAFRRAQTVADSIIAAKDAEISALRVVASMPAPRKHSSVGACVGYVATLNGKSTGPGACVGVTLSL